MSAGASSAPGCSRRPSMLWKHVWSSVSKAPSMSRIRVLICRVDDTDATHMADLAASDRPETDEGRAKHKIRVAKRSQFQRPVTPSLAESLLNISFGPSIGRAPPLFTRLRQR